MTRMTDPHNKDVRQEWVGRQAMHGNSPRAVLMKGLHPLLNDAIDRWHKSVLRAVFEQNDSSPVQRSALDIGCGFGRLAGEARACGLDPIGIDFTVKFCVAFGLNAGPAVCGDLSRLPFRDRSFGNAYSVTSLMYVPLPKAREALRELDRCLAADARILVLEPCREFNELVRTVLRRKRTESLTMPGFSLGEMQEGLVPPGWTPVGSGCSRWLTALLPVMAMTTRLPSLHRKIADLALRLDRPRLNDKGAMGRIAMYRWVAYRKAFP